MYQVLKYNVIHIGINRQKAFFSIIKKDLQGIVIDQKSFIKNNITLNLDRIYSVSIRLRRVYLINRFSTKSKHYI